jgi:arsenite methyltransferase
MIGRAGKLASFSKRERVNLRGGTTSLIVTGIKGQVLVDISTIYPQLFFPLSIHQLRSQSYHQASMSSTIIESINATYGSAAKNAYESKHNAKGSEAIAAAFGYRAEDLTSIPDGANLGLSCGNPLAVASVKEGEMVIDLGSGGGFDVFIAARQVGAMGKAVGVDRNPDMLKLANKNKVKGGYANVEFVDAPITKIPLENALADCIISNCVINLVPAREKHLVFEEMFRLLKPGGRVAMSDLLARKELPTEMRNVAAYVGCISGAALVSEYEGWLRSAGFGEVMIVDAQQDCNQYKRCGPDDGEGARDGCCSSVPAAPDASSCCGSSKNQEVSKMSKSTEEADLNEWIGSFKIYAVKK